MAEMPAPTHYPPLAAEQASLVTGASHVLDGGWNA